MNHIKVYILLTISLFMSFSVWGNEPPIVKPIPELNTKKTGLIIGAQKGSSFGIELGMERQWKEIKLKKPVTWAIVANGEYQFNSDVIGFKAGPWAKFGRVDFTYGLNGTVLSNFDEAIFGISPNIGFKIIGFHLLASYNLMGKTITFGDYNKLHVSLRYFISKNREFYWKKSKRKKKD